MFIGATRTNIYFWHQVEREEHTCPPVAIEFWRMPNGFHKPHFATVCLDSP